MSSERQIIANVLDSEEMRLAILEDGRVAEIFCERMWETQKAGEIFKARVDSVLPGMNAAFVNLGDGRNAFLYLEDARGVDIRANTEVVVQVVKTARKGKGARVSTRLSLPGRFLVLVPGGNETGVSKRILEEGERKRLRQIARALRPEGFGVIVRTVAEGVPGEALQADLSMLLEQWAEIAALAERQPAPSLLYRDIGLVGRILRDELNGDVSEIVLDCPEEFEKVSAYVRDFFAVNPPRVELYGGSVPIFEFYGIEKELAAALERKVWLPSGGTLVVDQTEALTVVDVNTGKYVGATSLRETVLKTNLEAAEAVYRVLRLRSIGGIVVVDFIDMEYEEDRNILLQRLEEVFRHDRCKARVYGVTQLGLVEITRKRARSDLRGTFTKSCPFCSGNGWVLKEDTVALSIKRFLRKVCRTGKAEALILELYPAVARHIVENYLESWEEEFERKIFLREMPNFPWEKFRLDFQGSQSQAEHKFNVYRSTAAQGI
ncbi:MAG TPA: Rne/Rng family ribonuclease [Synergistales bacterium]|nr:Rne/Rng family ribonuclease [Synergistales bacterium]